MGYAPGLIRYTTTTNSKDEPTQYAATARDRLRNRAVAMGIAFTVALFERPLVGIDVIRDRGELFHADRDAIRNDYTLKVVNKTQQPQTLALTVTAKGEAGVQPRLEGPATVDAAPGEVLTVPVTLAVAPGAIEESPFDVRFEVCDSARHCDAEKSDFFGPEVGKRKRKRNERPASACASVVPAVVAVVADCDSARRRSDGDDHRDIRVHASGS